MAAGPAVGGAWWVRALGGIAGIGGASLISSVRQGREVPLDVVAAGVGVSSLVLVSSVAPAWSGTLDVAALRSGGLLALAVGTAAAVGAGAVAAMRHGHA